MENEVRFNEFGLEFRINSIAFNIGKIEIRFYAIFILIAIITGTIYCIRRRKEQNFKCEDILILTSIIIVTAFIGARLYYILFKIKDYIGDPIKIFYIKDGGLAIYGGIIGAIIGIYSYCKYTNRKLFQVLDFIAPVLPLGQAIGRWGNFFNIEAHGTETTSIFRMGIYENGNFIEVHPTFLYESVICFIIFIILHCIKKKTSFDGELCCIYMIFYGISRSIIESLRTDSLMLGNIRISQIISIIIAVIGISVIVLNNTKRKNNEK